MEYLLNDDWKKVLAPAFDVDFKRDFFTKLNNEYDSYNCYPSKKNIFHALNLTPIDKVKVIILGQDPYHTPGQADGLAFSCANGQAQPSLQNIFKEIENDIGKRPSKTTLYGWAEQGVLLLNTILSVREHSASSHSGYGWEKITTYIIKYLASLDKPLVFILWGGYAKKYSQFIANPKHLVLTCVHPSPLSAFNGFFGCKHFSKTNEFLVKNNLKPIDWVNN